jgi:hypothetical protein
MTVHAAAALEIPQAKPRANAGGLDAHFSLSIPASNESATNCSPKGVCVVKDNAATPPRN